ncbi:N-acetyltransferase [Dyadobacter alkalitolerans]|uniref:N-acetyltransferase n=1 Tax=Dyadobacter alkalitolerans TaxID=492736 RepID=UPI0004069E88|nr:N-acetyltransferase [Dyadobacter alkalitolerans]
MEKNVETLQLRNKTIGVQQPVRITQPEPWQWNVLAKAFLPDPTLNFWLGETISEQMLQDFFEAVVKDTLASGGWIFSSPDRQVVFVWTRHAYSQERPTEWKKKWYKILGDEGVGRYKWLYQVGDVEIDASKLERSMLPDYMGVLPESQGLGYGSHIFKWTVNYFDSLGYETPFILASTRRSAKLYGPLLGYYIHKEVLASEADEIPVGVFMKRNIE